MKPLLPFFARFGMRIFDIREVDIHGGSFRIFVDRCRRDVEPGLIERFLEREEREGVHDARRLHRFAGEVAENRRQLVELLRELRASGKRVAGVSAPAKGMTLLNYCRIGTEMLDFVTEKSRLKIGRFTPGTHIPVVPDAELAARRPDFALLLAWNFATEIMGNLREYRAAGGRFIIPIPEPHVVGSEEKVRAA